MASSNSGVIDESETSTNGTEALEISLAEDQDAESIVTVIHAAFGARGPVTPPPPALLETRESVRSGLSRGDAVLAWRGEHLVGVIFLMPAADEPATAQLQRVSVHPDFQGHGVAAAMIGSVHALATERGYRRTELFVRHEFPRLRQWWERHGYRVWSPRPEPAQRGETDTGATISRLLPTRLPVPNADAMQALGRRLAELLRAGDLVILNGDLGAGKTTLTQGIGAGLDVSGPIVSPTFVLSRVHPSRGVGSENGGPGLVHVDAYRLGSEAELTDLDLETDLDAQVTVIEWGQGLAEHLSQDRLEIDIDRTADTRRVWIQPVGPRWDDVDLGALWARGPA